jgi:hypothetical protein
MPSTIRVRDIVRLHGSRNLGAGASHLGRYRLADADRAKTVRDVECPVCRAPGGEACTLPLRDHKPFAPTTTDVEPEPETKP